MRKEGFQFVIVGLPNVGKSSVMRALTNAEPLVSDYPFTTREPCVGMTEVCGAQAQVVDTPAIGSSEFDRGLVNNADCLLLVLNSLDQIKQVEDACLTSRAQRIYVFNKVDLLSAEQARKLEARLRSMRLEFALVSALKEEGFNELKEEMFNKMGVIRVYTKEPGKSRSEVPMLLPRGSVVRDAAEKILKGLSSRVKEARVTGPSAKFPNQRVGLAHELKDMDVIELRTS
ncbi:TGS domain-containing protein [Candidatus Pacearchaeota archaeon]|nr:MAG: TGS domain-containing protein [Candidatus Pacearchaeota archaeon]